MPRTSAARSVNAVSAPRTRECVPALRTLDLADGRRLAVRSWPGAGRTLVLLHGLLDSSEGWTGTCERLPARSLAFDLPGFGGSDVPARGSIAGYAEDVAAGLTELGVQRFTLVGHSLGGAVATALAEQMPDRIDALVLLAPAGFGRIRLAEAVSVPGFRNLVQATLPLALSNRTVVRTAYRTMVSNGRTPEAELIARVTTRGGKLVAGAREGTRAVVEAGTSPRGFHRRLVGYPGPVFAVWGDRDRLVPVDHRHAVATAFPQSRVEVWHRTGHHPQLERPDDLVALLQRALASRRPRTGRRRIRPRNGVQTR